ncbi:hypothetical protein VPHK409_0029 [Vibrio phage K409]
MDIIKFIIGLIVCCVLFAVVNGLPYAFGIWLAT